MFVAFCPKRFAINTEVSMNLILCRFSGEKQTALLVVDFVWILQSKNFFFYWRRMRNVTNDAFSWSSCETSMGKKYGLLWLHTIVIKNKFCYLACQQLFPLPYSLHIICKLNEKNISKCNDTCQKWFVHK